MIHKIVFTDGTEITSGPGTSNAIMALKSVHSCNSGTDLRVGSVCAAMVETRLLSDYRITAGTEFDLYQLDDQWDKVGHYICSSPTRTGQHTYKVTAYDNVSKLDIDLAGWLNSLDGFPYQLPTFAAMVAERCGVTIKNPQAIDLSYAVPKFTASRILGRQIMAWIAEICGYYLTADPDGELVYGWYHTTDIVIGSETDSYIYSGSFKREDYQTKKVEKIHIRLSENDAGVVYPDTPESLCTYVLQGNYLMTDEATDRLTPIARALYTKLKDVTYTPCKVSIAPRSDIHVGDIITINNGPSDQIYTVYVQKITTSGMRETIECTGNAARDNSAAANNEIYKPAEGRFLEIQKSIDGLRVTARDLDGRMTSLMQDTEKIIMEAMKEYATTDDLDALKTTISTQLQVLADGVNIEIKSVTDRVENVDGANKAVQDILSKYFKFTENGIFISAGGNDLQLNLDNDIIQFLRGTFPQLWMDEKGVHAGEIHTESIYLGDYAQITTDGNLITLRSVKK